MTGRRWSFIHLGLLGAWGLTIPAAFVFGWWESVPFIAFASVYANVATHWSAYQAARAEKVEEER